MTDRIATLAKRLREKGAATAAFFRALEPHDWSVTVYTEGGAWDARQVLCHFVSAEEPLLRLFRNIAAGARACRRISTLTLLRGESVDGWACPPIDRPL